jgi:hypothetical protein
MATLRQPILNYSVLPDANGNTYFEPASVAFGDSDLYKHLVLAFTSQSDRQGIAGKFVVPANYAGNARIVVVWSTTTTAGDVVWDFDYTAVGGDAAESLDPAADQEAATVTDTAGPTARSRQECQIALTAGNLAADDEVLFEFFRDAADAADTLAASAWVFSLLFQYTDA